MKHIKLLEDFVNEGAFHAALYKARNEGAEEFEFKGKKFPVHKKDAVNESSKRGGLSKEETLKIAEVVAKAIAKMDSAKVTVNMRTLEPDSFDLDYNGEEFDGGSYNIYDNGEVKNMAISGSPVYAMKNSTVDQAIALIKKNDKRK
jgi:hypothetical protein